MPVTSFIGEIVINPYQFVPLDFMNCSGQSVPISQYSALYSVIGSIYGGNISSTFCVPNLMGRVPVHSGQGPGLLYKQPGERGGTVDALLTTEMLPAHSHVMSAYLNPAPSNQPQNKYIGVVKESGDPTASLVPAYVEKADLSPDLELNIQSVSSSGSTANHENRQPFLGLRFCICLSGIYPARS
jgi:microcystin-dependent protein